MEKENIQLKDDLSFYIKLYKEIDRELKNKDTKEYRKAKVALLSSSTIRGLKEILFVKCYNEGILLDIFTGEYNQYTQEILDKTSKLYAFAPDLIFMFVDTIFLLGDHRFDFDQLMYDEKLEFGNTLFEQFSMLVNTLKQNLKSKIVVHNFEIPEMSSLGILENKQDLGFHEFVEMMNARLRSFCKNDAQVFVFNYEAFCARQGKRNIFDYKMYYLADIKIAMRYWPTLCDEYVVYIKALLSMIKKCLVLDLDNTLWGGIIGEEGISGIKLGPTLEGRPFLEFQKYILSLFHKGVILAVNSKNNLEDVVDVFNNHPHMILKEEHFASKQINWDDKVVNMQAIAKEINLGLDSFVFIDDDKGNREMVKRSLPQVTVIDLPEDPALYLEAITDIADFNSFHLIEEDRRKGQMYVEQRKRVEFSKSAGDVISYLKGLEMVARIEKANSFTIPRISQLTQKTNQFNMTTKRYLDEDIRAFVSSKDFLVFSVDVSDKFGSNGIVGTVIIEKKIGKWKINSFLLSCRVIGRRIEEAMLAYIFESAKAEGISFVIGEFVPTKKNIPAKNFFLDNGFKEISRSAALEMWEYDVSKDYVYPDCMTVIKENCDEEIKEDIIVSSRN